MLRALDPGTCAVTRIDWLARSTSDLFALVKRITDAGRQFRSMVEPWADTGRTAPGAKGETRVTIAMTPAEGRGDASP